MTSTLVAASLFALPASGQVQEAPPEPQQDAAAEVSAEEEAETGTVGTPEAADDADDTIGTDDSDLDDQSYETDDDVFVPSEEIPADEPIPFPSDI